MRMHLIVSLLGLAFVAPCRRLRPDVSEDKTVHTNPGHRQDDRQ